jgi:hypothetical protein
MAIINDALWSEVFITYEDGDTETIESLILRLKLMTTIFMLDMWTYLNQMKQIQKNSR